MYFIFRKHVLMKYSKIFGTKDFTTLVLLLNIVLITASLIVFSFILLSETILLHLKWKLRQEVLIHNIEQTYRIKEQK